MYARIARIARIARNGTERWDKHNSGDKDGMKYAVFLYGETLTLCFIEASHRQHIRIQITPPCLCLCLFI